jgi:bacillolysin
MAQLNDANKVTYNHNTYNVGDSFDTILHNIYNYAQSVLDFLNTVGLDSYDDNGAKIQSWGHYGSNHVNAFWNGAIFAYGDGNGVVSGPLGVLDIVAHEIGHAVTDYNSDLVYQAGRVGSSERGSFGYSGSSRRTSLR